MVFYMLGARPEGALWPDAFSSAAHTGIYPYGLYLKPLAQMSSAALRSRQTGTSALSYHMARTAVLTPICCALCCNLSILTYGSCYLSSVAGGGQLRGLISSRTGLLCISCRTFLCPLSDTQSLWLRHLLCGQHVGSSVCPWLFHRLHFSRRRQ